MTFHVGTAYWADARHCASRTNSSRSNVATRHGEHLHYRCETCGYDWTGDTADAEGAA